MVMTVMNMVMMMLTFMMFHLLIVLNMCMIDAKSNS
jgi:hypothetical protein